MSSSPSLSATKLPQVLHAEPAGLHVALSLKVPSTLVYFSGHFPVHAILPGVVQIDWAVHFGRHYFSLPVFQKMEALKFQAIIEPEQEVNLLLEYKPAPAPQQGGKLLFSFDSARGRHSSGRIVFTVGDALP